MENEKMGARYEYREDEGSASNTAAETEGSKAKENDNMTAGEKSSKAKADNLTTEAKGIKAKADNITTEAKGGKAREANFTAETRNDETEAEETRDRSEAETREGTIEITTKRMTMITEQGGGFPFQLGREVPQNEIKMIVSQTTEAGIHTSMTGQGTDDQWENYRGCTNWRKRHYRDENRDCWGVGKQKAPLNLRARRSQFWCRTEDVGTIPEDDMNADRWKAEAPPGIGDTNERSQNKTARGGEMNKQSADEEREGRKLET